MVAESLPIGVFKRPDQHPYDMLDGRYKHAYEKEKVLALMLIRCIDAGNWQPLEMEYDHTDMVLDGLLTREEDGRYSLTKTALGLLYTAYHK